MKPLKIMLSAAAFTIAALTAQAQTADDVINKHLDAIGGKDLLGKITSVHVEGTSDGGPVVTNLVVGKNYKSESEVQGASMVQCFSDKTGWAINPMAGSSAQEMPAEQYKIGEDQIYADPFLDYAARGAKAELQGKEGNTYKIKFTNKDAGETTYYIDTATYYTTKIVKTLNFNGNEFDLTVTLSNFGKTDFGNVMPNTVQTDVGTFFSTVVTVKKIDINKDIDPKIFEMPK